ncbi:TIGR04222 domain-containing membrane protein [Streptomyces sp. NPDC053541]|uniref:TIGR04222 domain-containing membrane protein n=1 Tax=Streptomyces sp. NPDC053541 TaxID=3365709 RepID=UPI0037D08763
MLWVPLLLLAVLVTGIACARACRDAVTVDLLGREAAPGLTVLEAAYLAGGPLRVADLALVSLHRARLVLLAHTGWVTVVDPDGGRDEVERAVLLAIGAEGQAPVPVVRPRVAGAECVRALAEGLVARGLALPEPVRRATAAGGRGLRAAFLLTLGLGAVAALLVPVEQRGPVLAWFALPLVAGGLCLLVARADAPAGWASPAGRRLLAELSRRDPMTALARRGTGVLEPGLRAAFRAPVRTSLWAAFRGHDTRHLP